MGDYQMIKYYKELENPEMLKLRLVRKNPRVEKKLENVALPITFFKENSALLREIQMFYFDIIGIQISSYLQDASPFDMDNYVGNSIVASSFQECRDNLGEILNEKLIMTDIDTMISLLNECKGAIEILFLVDTEDKHFFQKFESLNHKILLMIEQLESSRSIIYEDYNSKEIKLPNNWFITPCGDLYHSISGEVLKKFLSDEVLPLFLNLRGEVDHSLERLRNFQNIHLQKRNEIVEKGYITLKDFRIYERPGYTIFPLGNLENISLPISHDFLSRMIAVGRESAKFSIYKFYADVCENCESPVKQHYKMIEMVDGKVEDILLRGMKFHQIDSEHTKTILTSSIDFIDDLEEYLKNGWNIKYIPPIEINSETHQVEEQQINSIIKQKIKKYEKEKGVTYGKITY